MILDLILSWVSHVVAWVLTLMPTFTLPRYLTGTGTNTMAGTITGAVSSLWSLNAWFPTDQVFAAAGVVLAALTAAVGVRVVRIVASFLTAGGGSAA